MKVLQLYQELEKLINDGKGTYDMMIYRIFHNSDGKHQIRMRV